MTGEIRILSRSASSILLSPGLVAKWAWPGLCQTSADGEEATAEDWDAAQSLIFLLQCEVPLLSSRAAVSDWHLSAFRNYHLSQYCRSGARSSTKGRKCFSDRQWKQTFNYWTVYGSISVVSKRFLPFCAPWTWLRWIGSLANQLHEFSTRERKAASQYSTMCSFPHLLSSHLKS